MAFVGLDQGLRLQYAVAHGWVRAPSGRATASLPQVARVLGAARKTWLLGTASEKRQTEATAALLRALRHDDARGRFEAARALGEA